MIKRYKDSGYKPLMDEDPNGPYVKYRDHIREVAARDNSVAKHRVALRQILKSLDRLKADTEEALK